MACSPSGNMIFTAYSDNTIKMFDSRKAGEVHDLVGGHEGSIVKALLVSADESVVYSGGTDGIICIWDVA